MTRHPWCHYLAIACSTSVTSIAIWSLYGAIPSPAQGAPTTLPESHAVGVIPPELAQTTELAQLTEPELLQQLQLYSNLNSAGDTMPIPSAFQFSDVQPIDWAVSALQTLVERYGCAVGYPDGRFQGDRPVNRFEFATLLSTCLDHFLAGFGLSVDDAGNLRTLQQLLEEFAAELEVIQARTGSLEQRLDLLQVTPAATTYLRGEAIFALSQVLSDTVTAPDNQAALQSRVSLGLNTSFTGKDRLRTILQAGNFQRFDLPEDSNEGRLSFDSNTEGVIELDELSYETALGDRTNLVVVAQGGNLDSFVSSINPLASSGQGAISRFAQRNPIFRGSGFSTGSGVGVSYAPLDELVIELGYLGATSAAPAAGNGLFNGGYGLTNQAMLILDDLEVTASYVHSYAPERGNNTGTGSVAAEVNVGYPGEDNSRPVVINSYGLEANYSINSQVQVGGWVGFSAIRAIGLGDATVWNYAMRFGFPDLGGEGNLAGLVFGMQPRLTSTTPLLGEALGQHRDPDVGFHVEGFYRIRLTDHLSITPGLIWLTAPNHDRTNDDIMIGTIRTTFRF